MALNNQAGGRPWSRLHFLVRFAGLTGLVVAAAGLVLTAVTTSHLRFDIDEPGTILLSAGSVLAVLAALVEFKRGIGLIAGRRGALGSNVLFQVILASALLIGVNVFSFFHYQRFDWTRDKLFTIKKDIRDDLSKLRGETTVIVYLPHRSFGQQTDKPADIEYDTAAERKVVEKVKDLVEEFQELGPQFKVVVLDVQEKKGYRDKLAELTREAPDLRAAIDRATENSIFFYADGKVQTLGFQDVYELDKPASKAANGGRGNLVLYSQGVGPFARKVLNPDEKRPKIAVGVIHEVLSLDGSEEIGMPGLKKVLSARGFDSRDIILKKWGGFAGPEPAVLTYDENKFEILEEQLAELEANIKADEQDLKQLAEIQKLWQSATLDDLSKKYADQLRGRKITEPIRKRQLADIETSLALRQLELAGYRADREELAKQKSGLNVESLAEERRISDIKAKTKRMLDDCDLLILPRLTILNVAQGEAIPSWYYNMDKPQVDAIKDFLMDGKPVLFCLGPVNEDLNRRFPPPVQPDQLEPLVAELGIKLSRQTVLFNVESKSFAQQRGNLLILGANVEVPPVEFDWQPGAGQLPDRPVTAEPKKINRIRESMRLTTRSLGKDQPLALRLRSPRPVYCNQDTATKLPFDPVFMMTSPACWNDDQPFPSRERTPRYEPPKPGDPTKGTLDEKRRGPFPIGVAVETTLPKSWYTDKKAKRATVRVAAIGHGGVFIGAALSPVKEKLFLDVANWLMGRDDLLAKENQPWQYPRLDLSPERRSLWEWATRLGMPVLCIYFGLVVLLIRRLR